MKKLVYFLAIIAFAGCKKQDALPSVPAPANVSNITAKPVIGGVLLKWTVPADSNLLYLEVSYEKEGKMVVENVSKYTDSVVIGRLLNKIAYTFTVQSVNRNADHISKGAIMTTTPVKPLRRPDEITYFPNDVTKLAVTDDMLETYTQESSEGPKKNLVDGNIATYWHSAWSGATAPLPHWIQITFAEPTDFGAIKYYFRQGNGDVSGRPTQWGLQVSDNGTDWTQVWVSREGLPTDNPTAEKSVAFDKNYKSKYFKLMILKDGSMKYAHLGEIAFYKMESRVVDKEKEAEDTYLDY